MTDPVEILVAGSQKQIPHPAKSAGIRDDSCVEVWAMAGKQATVSDVRGYNSRPGLPVRKAELARHDAATREINISGNQLLVALAAGFSLAGPLLWAFVRYWLFAP